VNRDFGVVDFGGDVFSMSANRLAGTPLVEDVVGEVEFDAGAVLFCDRADENAIAVEELQVDGVCVGVVGIVEEERVESRDTGLVLFVDGSIDVVNWIIVSSIADQRRRCARLTKLVSDRNSITGSFRNCWPAVEFLASRADLGMIAEESVEGTKGCPSFESC
jgi:hypothetical protein